MCRKVAMADESVEVWGDGSQTRSFMYVDECVEATLRLSRQNFFRGPVNIGSDEMVSINDLAHMAINISGKNNVKIHNIFGDEFKNKYGFPCPVGVRGRNSDNKLYQSKLNWQSKKTLYDGMVQTYDWIEKQVKNKYFL